MLINELHTHSLPITSNDFLFILLHQYSPRVNITNAPQMRRHQHLQHRQHLLGNRTSPKIPLHRLLLNRNIKVKNIHRHPQRSTNIRNVHNTRNGTLNRRTRQQQVNLLTRVPYFPHLATSNILQLIKQTYQTASDTQSSSNTPGDTQQSHP